MSYRSLLAFAFGAWLACSSLLAQDDSQSSSSEPLSRVLKDGVILQKTRLLLEEPDGLPVVTGMTLQDLQERAATPQPAANLRTVHVEAKVVDGVAELGGTFEAAIVRSDEVSSLDLRFGTCQLTQLPDVATSSPGAQSDVRPSRDSAGYLWTLAGEAGTQQVVELFGRSVVKRVSDRYSLTIDLPVSISSVNLLLPADAIDESVRSEDLVDRTLTADGLLLQIHSRGGEMLITWKRSSEQDNVASVDAESTSTFQLIDPEQIWSATTMLTVRWYGSANKAIEIGLPEGARWRSYPSGEANRFRVIATSDMSSDGRQQGRQTIRVVGEGQSQASSIDIPLEWEWQPTKNTEVGKVALPMIHVDGVDRHRGVVNVVFPGSYAALVQRDELATVLQQGQVANAFGQQQVQLRFERDDFSVEMSFRREQSLPIVRPTYTISIDENRVLLNAWLRCSFDISRQQPEIGIVPGNWVFTDNSAQVLLDADNPYTADVELISMRRQSDGTLFLTGREPEGGFTNTRYLEQTWRITAVQDWDKDNRATFSLPQIVRGYATGNPVVNHLSGVLLVTGSDNALLKWNRSESSGLLPDSFSTEYQGYVGRRTKRAPLAYRFQSSGELPTWNGAVDFLPQQISYEQHANIEIQQALIQVRQDFNLQIANVPLNELKISIPTGSKLPQVLVNGSMSTLVSESPLSDATTTLTTVTSETNTPTSGGSDVYQLIGLPGLIGSNQVTISLDQDWVPQTSSNLANNVSVPLASLVLPADSVAAKQDWRLSSSGGYQVQLLGGPTLSSVASPASADERLVLPLAKNQQEIQLLVSEGGSEYQSDAYVEGSWLQSVLSGTQRRDRFVSKIASNGKSLRMRLPSLAQIDRVAVDGRQLTQNEAPYDYNSNILTINLPRLIRTDSKDTAGEFRESVVEVFYVMPDVLSWVTPVALDVPIVESAENRGRFFWQLITPSVHYLAWCPSSLTAEWRWDWSGAWWIRESGEDQASLERWLVASNQSRLPVSTNSYVMSGRGGEFLRARVWIVSRFILWFPIGGFAIGLALLVSTYPQLRSPLTLVLLASSLGLLAMFWPDLAMLLGQTSVVSLSLVLLLFVVQSAVDSRVRKRSVFSSRVTSHLDSSEQVTLLRTRSTQASAGKAASSVISIGDK